MQSIAVLASNSDVVQLLRDAVGEHGWEVRPYRSDEEFYADLARRRPDLLVVDVSPRSTGMGWPTVELVSTTYITSSIPLIVTSDNVFDLQNHMGWDHMQPAAVLVRPCSPADVLRCVTAASTWSGLRRSTAGIAGRAG